MKKLLFIHRSIGRNLIYDGQLRKLIANKKISIELSDYDQNLDILTDKNGKQVSCNFSFPGANTRPQDYAQLFTDTTADTFQPIRELALKYDMVMLKSCYPNSNIKNDRELEAIKNNYLQIAKYFRQIPDKQLILLTSPPLTPLMTNWARAKRARKLSEWLTVTDLGMNIRVFNFYNELADPKANWLARPYRRWLPVDSHPNAKASEQIAPRLVTFITSHL